MKLHFNNRNCIKTLFPILLLETEIFLLQKYVAIKLYGIEDNIVQTWIKTEFLQIYKIMACIIAWFANQSQGWLIQANQYFCFHVKDFPECSHEAFVLGNENELTEENESKGYYDLQISVSASTDERDSEDSRTSSNEFQQ